MLIDYRIEQPVALSARFEVEGFTVLLGASGEGKSRWAICRRGMRCFRI